MFYAKAVMVVLEAVATVVAAITDSRLRGCLEPLSQVRELSGLLCL
jgi:hypothetical protein